MGATLATLGIVVTVDEKGEPVVQKLSAVEKQVAKTEQSVKKLTTEMSRLGVEQNKATSLARDFVKNADQQALLDKMARSHRSVAGAALEHRLAIGRVSNALEGLAAEAVGANGKMASIASKFLEFGAGGTVAVGVLAGLAAMAFAWEKLTEETRKYHEETDKAAASLKAFYEQQAFGSQRAREVSEATQKLQHDLEELEKVQAKLNNPQTRNTTALDARKTFLENDIAAQRVFLATGIRDVQEAEAKRKQAIENGAEARQKAAIGELATLITTGNATKQQRANALALEQAFQAQIAQLADTGSAKRLQLVELEKQLYDALHPQSIIAAEQAIIAAKNEGLAATGKEIDALNQAYLKRQQDLEVIGKVGLELEVLNIKHKAEEDRLKALSDLTGASLQRRLADIDATQKQADAIARLNTHLDGQRQLLLLLNDRSSITPSVAKIGILPGHQTPEEVKAQHDFIEKMQQDWPRGLETMLTTGLRSWSDYFGAVFDMFRHMMKTMEDAQKQSTFGYKALGLASAGLAGGFAGYAAGQAIGSAGAGALGGAAAGAAAGSAFGAPGAIIGGLAGLTTGLLGGAKAARERAEAEHQLQVGLQANIAQIKNQLGIISNLDAALAQNHAQFEALRKQAEEALSGRKNEAERNRTLAELNDLEAKRADQIRATTKATEDATRAEAAWAEAMRIDARVMQDIADAFRRSEFDERNKYSAATDPDLAYRIKLIQEQIDIAQASYNALQDQLRAQEQLVEATRAVYERLKDYQSSLAINPQLSALSPTSQYQEAQRQLEDLYRRALLGDKDAASKFPDLANQFLGISKDFNASSEAYAADYARIQAMAGTLTDRFGATLSIQEQQLAEMQKQSAYLLEQIRRLQEQIDLLKAIQSAVERDFSAVDTRPSIPVTVPTPENPNPRIGPLTLANRGGNIETTSPDVVAEIRDLRAAVNTLTTQVRLSGALGAA